MVLHRPVELAGILGMWPHRFDSGSGLYAEKGCCPVFGLCPDAALLSEHTKRSSAGLSVLESIEEVADCDRQGARSRPVGLGRSVPILSARSMS